MGLWTIGVGHLIDTGDVEPRIKKITYDEAMAFLDLDINRALLSLKILVPASLHWSGEPGLRAVNQSRHRALTNMAFNLGSRLHNFTQFLAAVNANDWAKAAVEMMDSRWATQVGARAERLRTLILTDD